MTGSREVILARVREALSIGADEYAPGRARDHALEAARASIARVAPPIERDFDAQIEQFAMWSERLRTMFHVEHGVQNVRARVQEAVSGARVAAHRGGHIDRICEGLDVAMRLDGERDPGWKDDLAACDIGITECEALIANTGSVLITARSCGGRVLSVLPPHHVVLATRPQLVPDLASGYALLREKYGNDDLPRFISLITGPSRTGDIERILVLGAHGPKALTVILNEE